MCRFEIPIAFLLSSYLISWLCNASPRDMTVSILDQEQRKGNLRIREAFFIQKEKPEMNTKEESSIDLILF